MKKFCAIALCAVMCMSLMACSKKAEDATETMPEEAVEQQTTEYVNDKLEMVQETAPDTTTEYEYEKDPEVLHLDTTVVSEGGQLEDNTSVYSVESAFLSLAEDDAAKYPELQAALTEDYGEEKLETLKADLFEMIDDDLLARDEVPELCNETKVYALRADSNILTVQEINYWYGGGAHPEESIFATVYNTKTGEKLSLEDVVSSKDRLIDDIKTRLLQDYDPEMFNDLDGDLEKYRSGELELNWMVTYNGLDVWFNHYELAPYAAGIIGLHFGYAIPGYYKDGIAFIPDEYIQRVDPNLVIGIDGTDYVLETEYDEYGTISKLNITYGDASNSFDTHAYKVSPYVVKTGDKLFLYVFEFGDDDEEWMEMFLLDEDGIQLLGKKDGGVYYYENTGYTPDDTFDNINEWGRKKSFHATLDPNYFFRTTGKGTDGKAFKVAGDGLPVVLQ